MKKQKKYLIALEETRSVVALIAGLLTFVFTLAAVFAMFRNYLGQGEHPLQYFTVLSNLLAAVGAAFMIPFAVEGIRKKRFVLPRWIVRFQYAGATCVAITMIASLSLILPTQGRDAVQGVNFLLHVVTPVLTVVLFLSVESGVALTRRDALLALIPFLIYTAVYSVMVVLIGKDNGGWKDFYMTQAFWPAWISLLLMLALGFVVVTVLRLLQNRRAAQTRARIARAWSRDMEPAEILVEAFGLGRYIGDRCTNGELTVPLDIFAAMAERYGIPLDRLTKAYLKGALDAVQERKDA